MGIDTKNLEYRILLHAACTLSGCVHCFINDKCKFDSVEKLSVAARENYKKRQQSEDFIEYDKRMKQLYGNDYRSVVFGGKLV